MLSVAVALAAAGSLPAFAAGTGNQSGFYAGVAGGANFAKDSDITGGGITNTTIRFDTGPAAAGTIGYAFADGFRTEVEAVYRKNDIGSVTSLGSSTGSVRALDFTVNGLYDFDTGTRLKPYIGLGLGAVFVTYSDVAVPGKTINDTGPALMAYQGIAGVSYKLSKTVQLFVDYRYIGGIDLAEPDLTARDGAGLDFVFKDQTALAGLRFDLP